MMIRTKVLAAIIAGAALLPAIPAAAQEAAASGPESGGNFARDRNTSVRERSRPGLEATGVRAGGFLVYPRVTVAAEHNDNVYATRNLKVSDWAFRINPELAIKSNWSRHDFALLARAIFDRYADRSSENTNQYGIAATGRVDVVRGSYLSGGASFDRLTEPRTAPTAPTASREPIVYHLTQANIGGVREVSRLRLGANAAFSKYNYFNGVTVLGAPLIQNDRDRNEWVENARAEYAVSPDTSVYFAASANQRSYDLPLTAGGFTRDSHGLGVVGGLNFDITDLVRGDVQVGYSSQRYDNPLFPHQGALSFRGAIDWFATPLTTVHLTGSRTIEEAVSVNSSGYVSTNVGTRIDHELLRQLLVTAQASYGHDAYNQFDRTDKRATLGVAATYLVNARVGLRLAYDYQKLDSTGTNKTVSFSQNRVLGSVVLQY